MGWLRVYRVLFANYGCSPSRSHATSTPTTDYATVPEEAAPLLVAAECHNLGYWLFYTQRIVAHAFAEVLRQCCQEYEKPYVVTPPQFGVLALLQEIDGVTIGTISQRRRIDAPTVTGIVKRLEQSGLVERRHDEVDRRVVKVYLTAEGKDITKLLGDEVDSFDETLTRGISEAEQRDILAKFQRVIVNLDAVVPTSGERFGLLPHDFLCEPME